MELIILSKRRSRTSKVSFSPCWLFAGGVAFLFMLVAAFLAGGYYSLEYSTNAVAIMYQEAKQAQYKELELQRAIVNEARQDAQNNLDALAARLSKLQGHIMRLDALGSRLAAMANLDDIDFSISEPFGMGGPESSYTVKSLGVSDFIEQLEQLSNEIADRSDKLTAMESMLMDNDLQDKTLPDGTPVEGGWISSLFGWRTDPISGRKAFHEGVDFAGKPRTNVTAVAAGIVTWSDRRPGYGNMVEINHGNGYVTRYAHNKENLVVVGDKVEKGQPIAVIGSTGRSTGTHVHFEVTLNGKPVDPKKYISVN
jgi:murein DD-endopeptidase MepM/ murein hydrolase activator NlpD